MKQRERSIFDFPAWVVGLCVAVVVIAVGFNVGCHYPAPAHALPDASDGGRPDGFVPDDAAAACLADQGADDCGRAGNRLRALDCRNAASVRLWCTPFGDTFADACRAGLADSPRRDWHAGCLAHVPSCAVVDAVQRGKACP